MNLSTVKRAQWDKTHSRELLGPFICVCVCISLCTIVAHNIAQNRPDNFPSYPPDNHHCSDDVCLSFSSLVERSSRCKNIYFVRGNGGEVLWWSRLSVCLSVRRISLQSLARSLSIFLYTFNSERFAIRSETGSVTIMDSGRKTQQGRFDRSL